MSNADLLAQALHTADTIAYALVQWLIVAAVVASILAIAAVACGAWGIRAVMDRMDRTPGPSRARARLRTALLARTRTHDQEA